MKVVLDASVVIALLASDEEREMLVKAVDGYDFVCSHSISPEMGNAVSAMFKRGRITLAQGRAIIEGFQQLPIQLIALNLTRALEISYTYHIYAYDAHVLECAERLHAELITLDTRMQDIAQQPGIQVIETNMSLYTYLDARQQFDHLFDEAKEKREVMIQRPNGDLFLLRLVTTSELKQCLPQLGLNLSRQEIVESIREVRER